MNYWRVIHNYNSYVVPAVKAHTAVMRVMQQTNTGTQGVLQYEQITKEEYKQ